MENTPQLIEDVGIYIILGFIVVNTLIMWLWMRKESKKMDELYSFIKKLSNVNNVTNVNNVGMPKDSSDR